MLLHGFLHFNGTSYPLLICSVVHQILFTIFSLELLKILFHVVIPKAISICLLLPFFFFFPGNTFLKTQVQEVFLLIILRILV